MFEWYQKNLKQYEKQIFTVLLGIIVLGFVFSGVTTGPGPSDDRQKEYAVETPSVKLTRAEFDDLQRRWSRAGFEQGTFLMIFGRQYGQLLYPGEPYLAFQLGGQFESPAIKRRVAVDVAVLIGAAKDSGLRVSKREVEQTIKDAHGRQGGFDMDRYKEMLKNMSMEAFEYEKTVEEFLLTSKYVSTLSSAITASTQDILNEFMKNNDRAKSKYVFWNDVNFRKESESRVGSHEIAAYLDAARTSSEFQRSEQLRLEYLKISIDDLKAGVGEIKPEEISEYYASHKEDFRDPVYGPPLPPPEHLIVQAHQPDGTQPEPEPQAHYRTEEQARTEIVDKIRTAKAQERAAESVKKIQEAAFNLKLEGNAHPDLALLAKEFGLTPQTTPFFSIEDPKPAEDVVGTPQPGGAGWATFAAFKPETAPIVEVRTDKFRLLARLAQKQDAERYLFTGHIRHLARKSVASNTASRLTTKRAQEFVAEFKKRYDAAYAAILPTRTPTEEELAALRFDTFTALALERKLTVKETGLFTRGEDIPDVADDRPFALETFNLQATGDARQADGNSGQYVIQLVEKRAPDPDTFLAKKPRLEQTILMERLGKFVSETLAQYKKDNCKITVTVER